MKEKFYNFFDRALEYSLYGLIFFIPISKAGAETFAGFLLFFFILKKLIKPDFIFLKDKQNIFILLFFIFCGLSMLNSGPYLAKSLNSLFLKWIKYAGIFLFVQDVLFEQKRIKKTAYIILAISGLIAVDVIFQRFSGIDFLRKRELVPVMSSISAVTGPFNHYNDLASYLIMVLVLLVAILVANRLNNISQLAFNSLGVLLGTCLILSFSRGSWLGFFLALLLMLFLSKNFARLIPLVIISMLLLFLPAIKERFAFTFQGEGDADRLIVWAAAWRMIAENPFLGKGIGTFMDYFHTYVPDKVVQYAHNCYLQIWAETGVFSLLSFLLFIGAIFYKGIKAFKIGKSPVLLGLLCALFGFLVHSFFDTQFYSLQLAYLFWVILGITVAVTRLELSRSQ